MARMHCSPTRLYRLLAVLVGAVVLAVGLPRPPSVHAIDPAAELVAAVNRERAGAGLPALEVASDLADVARRHARQMADADDLHHNPDLGSQVTGWRRLSENVGAGPDGATIHRAFMASADHRDNLLDPEMTQVGIGTVRAGDRLWVTEVFRLPAETAPPAAEPAPATTPEPATAPTDPPAPPDRDPTAVPAGGTAAAPEVPEVPVRPADDGAARVAPPPLLVDSVQLLARLVRIYAALR